MAVRCSKGLTLVELIVAMTIVGLVMGAGTVVLLSTDQFFRAVVLESNSHSRTGEVVERISRELALTSLDKIEISNNKSIDEDHKNNEKYRLALFYYPFLGWDTQKNSPLYSSEKCWFYWNPATGKLILQKPNRPPEVISQHVVSFKAEKIFSPQPAHLLICIATSYSMVSGSSGEEETAVQEVKKILYLRQ